MSETQMKFLNLLRLRSRVGPHLNDYQGDFVHIDRVELAELIQKKMVGCRRLAHPYDRADTPYLRVTHKYRILKAGKIILGMQQ